MICKNCGAECRDDLRFCQNCGSELYPAQASAQPQADQNPYGQQPPYGQAPYGQTPYGQAPYGQYPNAAMFRPGRGYAIAALVLGIISIFLFPIITGTLAIIFGGVAKSKGSTSPMATAGLVCGIIGLVGWIVLLML